MENKIFTIFAVSVLFSLMLFASMQYYYQDTDSLTWSDGQFEESLLISNILFNNVKLNPLYLTQTIDQKGPFVPFIASLIYKISYVSMDTARLTNFVFLLVLLISLIMLEVHFKKGWNKGVYSPFLILFLPVLHQYNLFFLTDGPQTALMALAILFMLKSEHFKNRKFTLLFGLVFGLGQLTKVTFFLYIIGPFLYYFYLSFNKDCILNLSLAGVLAFGIAGWWYIIYFNTLVSVYITSAYGMSALHLMYGANASHVPKGINFFSKTRDILNYIFSNSHFLSALFGVSLISLFKKRKDVLFLLIWFFIPIFITASFIHQDTRYIYEMFVPFVLFISIGLSRIISLTKMNVSKWIALLLFLSSLFYVVSWYNAQIPETPDFSGIKDVVQEYQIPIYIISVRWGYGIPNYFRYEAQQGRFNPGNFSFTDWSNPSLIEFVNSSKVMVIADDWKKYNHNNTLLRDLVQLRRLDKTLIKEVQVTNDYNVSIFIVNGKQ